MPEEDGIEIDEAVLIGVLQNKVAQMAMREAQLEAAVQQLRGQVFQYEIELSDARGRLEAYETPSPEVQ